MLLSWGLLSFPSLRPCSSVCSSPNTSVQECFWLGQLVTDAVFKQGWLLPRVRPRALESYWLFVTVKTWIVGMQTSLWPSATGTWPFVGIHPESPAWGTCWSLAFFLAASVNSSAAFCNESTYSPRTGQRLVPRAVSTCPTTVTVGPHGRYFFWAGDPEVTLPLSHSNSPRHWLFQSFCPCSSTDAYIAGKRDSP